MKHHRFFILIAVAALALASCKDNVTTNALSLAESLMWTAPDSALAIMKSVDTTKLSGSALRARYSLLYSMALDRNHVVVTDSRIITPSVRYYRRHGLPDERLKSLCYLGRVQNAAGKYNQAVVTLSEALEHSDKVKDRRMVGFVYSDIALSYTNTYNYSECDVCYDKARACFEESGNVNLARMMEVNKAKNYASMLDYNAADSLFRRIINDYSFPLSYRTYSMAAYGLLLSFGKMADERKALGLFEEAISLSGGYENILSLNQKCAYAYLLDMFGRKEESLNILTKLKGEGYGESPEYYYCMGRICRLNGNDGLAFDYLVKSTQNYDAVTHEMQIQSSSVAQKNYYLEQTIEREKALISHRLWTSCYVAVSIFVILIIGIFLYKRAHKAEVESQRILLLKEAADIRLDETDKSIAQIRADYEIIKKDYLELYLSQGSWLAKLADILYTSRSKELKPYGLRAEVYDRIAGWVGGINDGSAGQRRFETELNKIYGGIMTQFRNEFSGLNETDIRFFSCIVAGFDASTILKIFNMPSKGAVYMRKKRLKEVIRIGGFG